MTLKDFLSKLTPAEGCSIKIVKDGAVVSKCYAAYWASLNDDLKNAEIDSWVVSSATSISVILATVIEP